MWGDNDRQLEAVGDIGNKGKQDGKAGIPSNRGTQEGRPCETRPRESGHTIQDRRTCGETNERQAEARPRKSNAGTYVGRTLGDSGSYHPNTGTQRGRLWETSGGDKTGMADTATQGNT